MECWFLVILAMFAVIGVFVCVKTGFYWVLAAYRNNPLISFNLKIRNAGMVLSGLEIVPDHAVLDCSVFSGATIILPNGKELMVATVNEHRTTGNLSWEEGMKYTIDL